MALQVWLPMNGNLNNQGLTDITVTNSGATVDNNGKIGKCYNFDGSDDYIQIVDSNIPTILNGDFSICMWIYNDDSGGRSVLFGNYSLSSGFFNIEKYTAEQIRFYWNGTPDYSTSVLKLPTSTWSHLTVTRQGGSLKFYLNGELKDSPTVTITGTIASASTTYRLGMDARTGTTAFKGKLNDFRLYDHALSPKEIEILSRGLVCHYPLNNNGNGQSNIMPNSYSMQLGTSSATNGVWRLAGDSTMNRARVQLPNGAYCFQNSGTQTANDGSCYGMDSFPMDADTDYVLSMCARITSGTEGYAGFVPYNCTITGGSHIKQDKNYYVTPLTDSWQRCWISFHTNSATTRNIYIGITTGSTSVTTQMCLVKLEKGTRPTPWMPNVNDAEYSSMGYDSTTEYDVSGYNYHGTRNGTFAWDSNTARYSVSTKFNGTDNAIQIPFYQMLGLSVAGKTDYTVNVWTYKTSIGTKGYQTILGGTSGFELEARNGSGTDPQYTAWNWGKNTGTYEFNKWCMFTFVHTTSDNKIYVNGEYASTGSAANIPISNFFIGSWNTTTSQNYEGLMSDFRIYATALSAEQVAELYNTAVSVANNGTLMGYELVEV